jgi:plastocyanin
MIKSFFGSAVMAAFLVGNFGAFVSPAQAVTISSGDLIRGTTFSAVYYMGIDGMRYVFPNEKTYKTWYMDASGNSDFSDVVMISDAELADIQLGGNVTYKPGVRMVKINSDAKVYFVTDGGVLRPVASEAAAKAMYGTDWNKKIDDVPDAFFGSYTLSTNDVSESETSLIDSDFADTINEDKSLLTPEDISITDSGYNPLDVTICIGQNVRFTNSGTTKHTATSDDLTWGSGTLQVGDTFIRKFNEEGTITFYDGYDSTNTGAIFVEDCE